jgi:phosphoribosylamine--glycine ligase
LAQSKHVESIYVSPGNAGTDMVDKCCNINLNTHKELLNFAKENNIDLTIVGPEKTLVEGIVDLFKKHKLNIFGPSKIAAKLEGSKIFAKNFMKEFKVKTANYKSFNNPYSALSYLKHASFPLVIKANGLAAGKGVVICNNFKTAQTTITQFMLQHSLEQAGKSIIIEEFLIGIEASIICLTDGKTMVPLISARDYKTIYENNKGPNTGGMGAISPNNYCTDKVMDDFIKNIMNPTLNGIKKSKMDFHGFVFFGIMITKNGCKCLEYNVRMGDPECQSIIPLMNFDLLEMFQMTLKNQLHKFKFI